MNIRVLLVLLAISLLLACTPRWRKVGLIASVVWALLLIWFTVKQPATDHELVAPARSASSTAQVARLAPVVTLQLEGSGAPWKLMGTVTNPGEIPIRSITLQIERLDCPAIDSTEADCTLTWRGQHTLRLTIAATRTIKIDDSFYSHEPVPRLKNVVRDRISVISVQ